MKIFCDEFANDLFWNNNLMIEFEGRLVAIKGVSYFDGYDIEKVSIFDERFSELTEGKWGHFSGDYFCIPVKKSAVLAIHLISGEDIRFEEWKNGLPTIHKFGENTFALYDEDCKCYRIRKNNKISLDKRQSSMLQYSCSKKYTSTYEKQDSSQSDQVPSVHSVLLPSGGRSGGFLRSVVHHSDPCGASSFTNA